MFQKIAIEYPGPPRGKSRPRSRIVFPRGGKPFVQVYPDRDDVSYEEGLKWFAKRAMAGRPPIDEAVVVNVTAYMPIPPSWSKKKQQQAIDGMIAPVSKPDVDNVVKAGLDALNKLVWTDDSRVVGLFVWKFYSQEPRLTIGVEPWLSSQIKGEIDAEFSGAAIAQ